MEIANSPGGRKFAESMQPIQAFQHMRSFGGKEATSAG
jgi:hypothetical protein